MHVIACACEVANDLSLKLFQVYKLCKMLLIPVFFTIFVGAATAAGINNVLMRLVAFFFSLRKCNNVDED